MNVIFVIKQILDIDKKTKLCSFSCSFYDGNGGCRAGLNDKFRLPINCLGDGIYTLTKLKDK